MASPQRQLVDRYFYKGWNKCDAGVMEEILDEKLVYRGALSRKKRNRDDFIEYMRKIHGALGNNVVEAEDVVISDNKAAVRMKCSGIHKSSFFGVEGTGHEISYQAAMFFTFTADGTRIKEIWMVGDIDGLKHQLGATSEASVF